jgi:hypothetical protein
LKYIVRIGFVINAALGYQAQQDRQPQGLQQHPKKCSIIRISSSKGQANKGIATVTGIYNCKF